MKTLEVVKAWIALLLLLFQMALLAVALVFFVHGELLVFLGLVLFGYLLLLLHHCFMDTWL